MQTTIPTSDHGPFAELAALADEHEVTELLGALAAAVDAHDVEAERSCWLRGAVPERGPEVSTSFSMQFRSDLRVTVDGDRATAESLVIAPSTVDIDGEPGGGGGDGRWRTWHQRAELVRAEGRWCIGSLVQEPIIDARYEDGWGTSG